MGSNSLSGRNHRLCSLNPEPRTRPDFAPIADSIATTAFTEMPCCAVLLMYNWRSLAQTVVLDDRPPDLLRRGTGKGTVARPFLLKLLAALLDDAGVEHRLRESLPHVRLKSWNQLSRHAGDGRPDYLLADELADIVERDFAVGGFDTVERLLAGDLHDPQHFDLERAGDPAAEQSLAPATVRCSLRGGAAGIGGGVGQLRGRFRRRRARAGACCLRERSPEVINTRAFLLFVKRPVVHDEVHGLLLGESHPESEVAQGEVVPAL